MIRQLVAGLLAVAVVGSVGVLSAGEAKADIRANTARLKQNAEDLIQLNCYSEQVTDLSLEVCSTALALYRVASDDGAYRETEDAFFSGWYNGLMQRYGYSARATSESIALGRALCNDLDAGVPLSQFADIAVEATNSYSPELRPMMQRSIVAVAVAAAEAYCPIHRDTIN